MNHRDWRLLINGLLVVVFVWAGGLHALRAESGTAASDGDLFVRANTAYASGKYSDAVGDFEQMVGRKEFSAPLFYNLGNAYFRSGKTGPAILNYERALWLNPADPDAKANLRFVRKTAGLFEPTAAWWQFVPGWISLNVWSWIASISWFFLCTVLIIRSWKKGTKWTYSILAVSCAVLVLALACALIRVPDLRRAVVLVAEVPLRVAPLEKSPAPSTLKVGDMVRIENQRGPFFYVETEDGKTGWANDHEVAPIIPHS